MNETKPIRLLLTHREVDSIVLAMAQGLAQLPDFEVYMTADASSVEGVSADGIHYLPVPTIRHKFKWDVIRALYRYNQQYQFDLIYSVGSSGLSNALMATLGSKTRNIAYRGTGARIRRMDPTYYLGILNPRVRHIVCETSHVADYLKEFFPADKLSVAVKPFSLSWVEEALAKPIRVEALAQKELVFIIVANTKGRPYKGLTTLIEAMNRLADPRVGLVVVGDYEPADYALSQAAGLGDSFFFAGSQPNALSYIAGADVYVLPSYRDASPRVVREAMAIGLPTIVSNIPGSRDLILPGQTGLLAEPQDAGSLVEAMRWMLEHPEERQQMGQAGRKRIETDFSLQAYTELFADLFRRQVGRL